MRKDHPFSRQIVKFSTLAKATQPRYGIIRMPAANDFGQNEMVVSARAASKAATSTKAAPGRWKPMKNGHDQAALKAKGQRLHVIVSPNEPSGHGHHGNIERGPKIQLGGFHVGFAKPAYQVAMFGVVAREPMPAAAKMMARKTTRATLWCKGDILTTYPPEEVAT
jgi:hypothetical protein